MSEEKETNTAKTEEAVEKEVPKDNLDDNEKAESAEVQTQVEDPVETESAQAETESEENKEEETAEEETTEKETDQSLDEVVAESPRTDVGVVVGPSDENDRHSVVQLEKKLATEQASADLLEETGYTPEEYEEMMTMYEPTLKGMKEGSIVTGRVLKIYPNEVLVDVGLKSEGVVQRIEFKGEEVKEGDEIEVFIENVEDLSGMIVLSKQRADFLRVWDRIKDAYDNESVVEGTLKRKIKGGVLVDLYGVEAFLPGSQVALRPVPRVDDLIGETYEFMIIKLNKRRRNIVVSRRMVLEQQRKHLRERVLDSLEKNQIREGVVKNITDFGAFIDLGGIDGLLHITDMSWGRIKNPHEVLSIGETIQVKVLDFNMERQRISLGLKQLSPYPWEDVDQKYPVGSRINGVVVSITDYGAFVELEKGVEGLVHISEMSWTKNVKHPSHVLTVGDSVEAIVLNVNRDQEKISLGLKQVTPDPWSDLHDRYPIGTVIKGSVRNLTSFGAFIELEEGIDGLVHISDMDWVRKIRNPSEVLKKGQEVEVMILHIDRVRRRISLGLKQLTEDPWPGVAITHAVGMELEAEISKIAERGVYVELAEGAEGFVPISQLGYDNIQKIEEHFAVGDKIPLRVIELNNKERRIILSVKEYLSHKEEIELEKFNKKHMRKESMTLKSIIGDQLENAAAEIAKDQKVREETAEAEAEIAEAEVEAGEAAEEAAVEEEPVTEEEAPVEEEAVAEEAPVEEEAATEEETVAEEAPVEEEAVADEAATEVEPEAVEEAASETTEEEEKK